MNSMVNPALDAFLEEVGKGTVFGQIQVRVCSGDFELKHADDVSVDSASLRRLETGELRHLAQFTAGGEFRPLKSAPSLQRGWVCHAAGREELERALQELYPGSIADWFAFRSESAKPTTYRDFTNRQTGMYRVTQSLSDARAGEVASAVCHSRFCLKRRLWTLPGLDADPVAHKSAIPCLEPCALLLELGRTTAKMDKDDQINVSLAPDEWRTIVNALDQVAAGSQPEIREADFSSPANSRRVQLLATKLRSLRVDLFPGGDA